MIACPDPRSYHEHPRGLLLTEAAEKATQIQALIEAARATWTDDREGWADLGDAGFMEVRGLAMTLEGRLRGLRWAMELP
jgi:hypothetical protein